MNAPPASTPDPAGRAPLWPRRVWVEALVILLLLLILGLPNLVYPFGTDQGEYAQIASEMLAGKVIYRDVFNVKPPVTHVLHAAAQLLFGHNMLGLRLLDWWWQAATGVVIGLITSLLYRRRYIGILAGLLYGIGYYSVDFWHSAQTDGFVNLPAALSVLFFLLGLALSRPGRGWWVAAGAMVGVAVLTKYPIGLLLPILWLILFLVQGVNRASLGRGFWLGLGFGLPLLFFVALSGLRGGLPAFLDIQFGYIPFYNSGFARDQSYLAYTWQRFLLFWDLKSSIRLFAAVWLAEVFLSGLAGEWPRTHWLVPLWAIAGLVYPAVQNHYNDGHMHTILPPLAIMLAHLVLNVEGLARRYLFRTRPGAATALALALALLIPGLLISLPQSPYQQRNLPAKFGDFWAVVSGERSLEENYLQGAYGTYGYGFSARAIVEAGHYLQDHTDPADAIFVWSFEPAVYFLSERASASRFIFNFPLYGDFAWPEYREAFLAEMAANRPRIILVARNDAMPWVSGTQDDSQAAFEKFLPFKQFVESEYEPVGQVAQFTIYERKAQASSEQ